MPFRGGLCGCWRGGPRLQPFPQLADSLWNQLKQFGEVQRNAWIWDDNQIESATQPRSNRSVCFTQQALLAIALDGSTMLARNAPPDPEMRPTVRPTEHGKRGTAKDQPKCVGCLKISRSSEMVVLRKYVSDGRHGEDATDETELYDVKGE